VFIFKLFLLLITLVSVLQNEVRNVGYTSQLDSRFATLTGSRNGDKFTGHDGVVMHSDTNAADNVLARMSDVEITRYMKHSDVKVIFLERTQKFRDSIVMEPEAITGKDNTRLRLYQLSLRVRSIRERIISN
jgi:hypothetical protein